MTPINLEFPLVLTGSNSREHHMARARRVKRERGATYRQLAKAVRPGPLLVVRLTRIAPRTLDPGDNLPISLKGVRDQVSAWLGVDDRTTLVRWVYAQEQVSQPRKAPPVDRVRVEVRAPGEQLAEWVSVPPAEYGEGSRGDEDDSPATARPRRLKERELAALATPASYPAKKGRP